MLETEKRPWGTYTVIEESPRYKLKTIVVEPGKRLSLQRHQRRREHWYVVDGTASVEIDGQQHTVLPGQAIDIPVRAWHRVANHDAANLIFIEIQTGDYFGEDDIERMSDDYGRTG